MMRMRSRLLFQTLEDVIAPATFTVMNLNDSGAGSLRAAITSANTTVGNDDIVFKAGLFGAITLTTGQLSFSEDVSIFGPGIVVNGNNATRVFDTTGAAAGAKIAFLNLAIVNGKVAGDGGGILAGDEVLTVVGCTISGNSVSGASSDGGGIALTAAGSLTMAGCTVTDNHSDNRHGGGIDLASGATAIIAGCVIAGNSAFDAGGGIHCVSGSLTVTNSTVANNTGKRGGGLNFFGTVAAGGLTIRNCTFSGNTSTDTGGAIELLSFNGTLTVQNSTITANTAGGSGGGGIGRVSGAGVIEIESTIVALNTDNVAINEDLFTTGTLDATFSAVGTATGAGSITFDAVTTSLLGANLKLGPLANNGGSGGQTHVPAPDSPLINQGSNPAALTTDQRGSVTNRNSNGGVDIGSVELQRFLVSNTSDSGSGSLRLAVINANSLGGSDLIQFLFLIPETITLTSGEIAITDAVTITGPPAKVTIDANSKSRIFNISMSGTGGPAVTLQKLTLAEGAAADDGGAIIASKVTLILEDCSITNSTAGKYGGGLYVFDSVVTSIRRSTFKANTAGELGGAIMIQGGGGDLTVEASTISGNSCGTTNKKYGGGGIVTAANILTVINTTLSGNTASASIGGGVFLFLASGNFHNCTIAKNTAGSNGGGIAARGSSVTLASTIVAGNINSTAPDLWFENFETVTSNDSLIGVVDENIFKLTGSGNQAGSLATPLDAKLGPLTDNGGPTFTRTLLAGSPAINQGSNLLGLATDQRGAGFPRVSGSAADIGAVEIDLSTEVTNTNNSGIGSLRQAIINANMQAGPDTVTFDPTIFASAKTITLTTGEIAITEALSIAGPAVGVTVGGNNSGRIFNTAGAASKAAVMISGLTLTGGNTTQSGGAVFVEDESFTLTDCVITGNTSGAGGAIYVLGTAGSLTLLGCTVSNNSTTGADAEGGGVFIYGGSATVKDTTISGNTATGSGGGLVFYVGGSLLLEGSTISGNQSSDAGGGLYFSGAVAAGGLKLVNSTVSGNTSGASGGGIGLSNFTGTLTIQNSTITNNTAGGGLGGGIARVSGGGAIHIESAIVSGNTNASAPDLFSQGSVNVKTSAIGSGTGFSKTDLGGNLPFQPHANLLLGSLTNNGGPTLTHGLLAGSPALNKGSNVAMLANDQRGPGFLREVGPADIGAFELQVLPAAAKITGVEVNGGAVQRSLVTSIKVTFDSAVTLPLNPSDAFQLKRNTGGAVVNLSAVQVGNDVTLTFTGGAVNGPSLADGRYTLTVLASQINSGGLDGNGDGTPGDDFVLVGDPAVAPKLFRLFGDADGDNDVDTTDFAAFRVVYGGASSIFDFDNDGDVDTSDFGQFRGRFGASV